MADRTVAIEDILDAEHAPCRETISTLEAENAKLREALTLVTERLISITIRPFYDEESREPLTRGQVVAIARAALSEKPVR